MKNYNNYILVKMNKKNRPVQLSERLRQNSGLAGSAAQKWCLFWLLSFLMAHSYWDVYLIGRDIVIAPKVKREILSVLN